jgi:hypothetical protein
MELMRDASQQAMKPLPAAVGSPATVIRGFAPESEVSRRAANKTKSCPNESLFLFCADQTSNLRNIALPTVLVPCFPGHNPS